MSSYHTSLAYLRLRPSVPGRDTLLEACKSLDPEELDKAYGRGDERALRACVDRQLGLPRIFVPESLVFSTDTARYPSLFRSLPHELLATAVQQLHHQKGVANGDTRSQVSTPSLVVSRYDQRSTFPRAEVDPWRSRHSKSRDLNPCLKHRENGPRRTSSDECLALTKIRSHTPSPGSTRPNSSHDPPRLTGPTESSTLPAIFDPSTSHHSGYSNGHRQSWPSEAPSWASIASAPAPSLPLIAPLLPPSMHLARHGSQYRIDPPPHPDKELVNRMKLMKLCNVLYLRGDCHKKDCHHNHHYDPTAEELDALRTVARMAPCSNGQFCKTEGCIYGHCCPMPLGKKNQLCTYGDRCKFPDNMHASQR